MTVRTKSKHSLVPYLRIFNIHKSIGSYFKRDYFQKEHFMMILMTRINVKLNYSYMWLWYMALVPLQKIIYLCVVSLLSLINTSSIFFWKIVPIFILESFIIAIYIILLSFSSSQWKSLLIKAILKERGLIKSRSDISIQISMTPL